MYVCMYIYIYIYITYFTRRTCELSTFIDSFQAGFVLVAAIMGLTALLSKPTYIYIYMYLYVDMSLSLSLYIYRER